MMATIHDRLSGDRRVFQAECDVCGHTTVGCYNETGAIKTLERHQCRITAHGKKRTTRKKE